ncbi:uncharacterized protein E0L32_003274 [Thyridium curvatum]|uniref:Tat pathway signal sequence n=1 Tax=Thyridium curvatum TaxID=1093900 RepID=A0A507BD21_9PEZI|nr:uncharacterized protein E0L32_003274 [Thyridium curvatum]TPX17156.1 hypothetical protein E0L32_003274 [Thyridium curvatum]
MAGKNNKTSLASVGRMPMISEDEQGQLAPALPARSGRRSAIRSGAADPVSQWSITPPSSTASSDESPSEYKGPPPRAPSKTEEWFRRRGGWYRVGLLAFLIVALVVGLGAGLGIGLRKKNQHSSTTPPSSSSPQPALFPSGSYSFTAALVNTSTACSSDPQAFACYPYSTYSPSDPASSAATFHWVIAQLNSFTYAVSSSASPFAPSFANVTMALLDGNQHAERLAFEFPAAVSVVVPPGATTCWYNGTVFSATLWTRMRATYPPGVEAAPPPTNASTNFAAWPFRVEIVQRQRAGAGVPDCRDRSGQPLDGLAGSGDCGCWYSNYGLGNGSRSDAGKRWTG